MADTFTSKLRLRKPEVGAQNNLWGPPVSGGLNDGVVALLDAALAGKEDISVTAGNVTLTAVNGATDTSRAMFLRATGTPGVARNITVPDPPTQKMYILQNDSDAVVTLKTVSGAGSPVTAGQSVLMYVDEVLDNVFPVNFLTNVVFEAPAWTTGTLTVQDATAGDLTITYRFSVQGETVLLQIPAFSSTITPGATYEDIFLNALVPAALPTDLFSLVQQTKPMWMNMGGVISRFALRVGRRVEIPNSFQINQGTATPILYANGSVATLPHNLTIAYSRITDSALP